MNLEILKSILEDLLDIYKSAVTNAKNNDNYVLVGKIKKGDFYAEYRSLDDIRQLINNTREDIGKLELNNDYAEYGYNVHNRYSS